VVELADAFTVVTEPSESPAIFKLIVMLWSGFAVGLVVPTKWGLLDCAIAIDGASINVVAKNIPAIAVVYVSTESQCWRFNDNVVLCNGVVNDAGVFAA
jgi:hypothetical protein